MLKPSPFSSRAGTIEACRKRKVGPAAVVADVAELVCATLLLGIDATYDQVRERINELREYDKHVDRDLQTAGITTDALIDHLHTTMGLLKTTEHGTLIADDAVGFGWLAGRGIVRFIEQLRPDVPAAVAWADALADLAWRHEHRETRTSMARQLIQEEQYNEIESLCNWLHAHCTQGLDDLSQTLKFCLWQFSVEILNAGLPNDPQRFGRWATATTRFATIERGHLFPLLGMPADWAGLLNEAGAEAWEQRLFDAVKYDDADVQRIAWEALRSHSMISERSRIRLADLATSSKVSAERAAAVLSVQCPRDDEGLSISRIVDGLASTDPNVVHRCVRILLHRIDQPNVQHHVQNQCHPYAKDDTIFKMAHQLLRAARLNSQTLEALVEVVLKRPAWYAEQACKVLLAQYELPPAMIQKLEVGEGQIETFLFLFARRYRSHLMLRFGNQVTPFQFPYGRHSKTYQPDPLVTANPTFFNGRNQEQFDWLLSHFTLDEAVPSPQDVIDAFVSARVLADAKSLSLEPFVPMLSSGSLLQRSLAERALKPHIANSTGDIYTMMQHDRQLVGSSLAHDSDFAVIVAAPDRLRPVLRRVLRPGWQYCTQDDFKLGIRLGDEVYEYFDRETLTLDDDLRGHDLVDAEDDDQGDDPSPDADGERPDASASPTAPATPSPTVGMREPTDFQTDRLQAQQHPSGGAPRPADDRSGSRDETFGLLYDWLNAMRMTSENMQGLGGNSVATTIANDVPRPTRRDSDLNPSEATEFLAAFQRAEASTDEGVRFYIVQVMKRIESILTRDAQVDLDEVAFTRILDDLGDRLSRLKCRPKPTATFLYFLAWCAVRRAHRPDYEVVTQAQCPISLGLLPQRHREVWESDPITNAGTLTRNLDRFFEDLSFNTQLQNIVRDCAGLREKRRATRVSRR